MEKKWVVYDVLNGQHEIANTWEDIKDIVATYIESGCPVSDVEIYQMVDVDIIITCQITNKDK